MASILVIEDEALVRETIKDGLERGGHEVVVAVDGRDGMSKLACRSYDVVVTDLIMPEQEGLETIRLIRRDYPTMRIVAISGGGRHLGADYLKSAKMLGADCAIEKPFPTSRLRDCVASCLAGDRKAS